MKCIANFIWLLTNRDITIHNLGILIVIFILAFFPKAVIDFRFFSNCSLIYYLRIWFQDKKWFCVVRCGSLWFILLPCGSFWFVMVSSGPSCPLAFPCGPLRSLCVVFMVHCGSQWSIVVNCETESQFFKSFSIMRETTYPILPWSPASGWRNSPPWAPTFHQIRCLAPKKILHFQSLILVPHLHPVSVSTSDVVCNTSRESKKRSQQSRW